MPVFRNLGPTNTILRFSVETGGAILSNSAPTSVVYPAANRAIFFPFRLFDMATAYSMVVSNGAAVSGNIDMGIYSIDGTRLVSKGSTAHANTNVKQQLTFTTPLKLGAGYYFAALACDNITSQFFRKSLSSSNLGKVIGMYQAASAFPLPATVTFATYGSTYDPLFGVKFYNV